MARAGVRGRAAARRAAVALLLLTLVLAIAGCASGGTGGSGDGDVADESGIEVPDASGGDGADAVSSVEDAGLTATLADANDDPGFDSSRDATGCEVTDQDPAADDTAAEDDEVTITVDCSQVDWDNRDGPGWEAFSDAYGSGFDDGCQQLFNESPTGSLFENGVEYTATDCQNDNPGDGSDASDIPDEVPDDPEAAGTEAGELDGCQALFEQEGVSTLNYGADTLTEDDCPVGATAAAPSQTDTGPGTTSAPSATTGRGSGGPCTGKRPDGRTVVVRVEKGKVNCSGAVALTNEWLRRAPSEGRGSSGALTLDGWDCAGARATQAPRLGSCSRTDGSAAFSISERR